MVTTPVAMRSSVCAQLAGVFGMPIARVGVDGAVGAVNAGVAENASKDRNSEIRDMPILGLVALKCLRIGHRPAPAVPPAVISTSGRVASPRAHHPIVA